MCDIKPGLMCHIEPGLMCHIEPQCTLEYSIFFYMLHALDLMVPASKDLTEWEKSYGGPYGGPYGPPPSPLGGPFGPPSGPPSDFFFGCRVISYWNSTL